MYPNIDNFYDRLVYAKNNYYSSIRWNSIAREVGIDKANFSRYKNRSYFPSPVTLLKIARVLGVNAFWLAGDDIELPEDKLELLTVMYEALDSDDKEEVLTFRRTCFMGDTGKGTLGVNQKEYVDFDISRGGQHE